MAQHKAPTAVTIAPTSEQTAFQAWVGKYWLPGIVLLLAGGVAIVLLNYRHQQQQVEREGTWSKLVPLITPNPYTQMPEGSPEAFATAAESLKGERTGAWARLLEARSRQAKGDFDGASKALKLLEADHAADLAALAGESAGEGATAGSPVAALEAAMTRTREWEKARPELFANPPPPADAPKVRLTTDKGVIVVQLYPNDAPKHVENFLKLCRDKFYDGTRFHRVESTFMIQGGDPNSKTDATATWGQGGPGYTLPQEPSKLHHFAGVLSMAKKEGDWESSGSQFFITVAPAHHLDGEYTIFGAVVEGMDVVKQIAEGPIAKDAADRPENPVAIKTAEVL